MSAAARLAAFPALAKRLPGARLPWLAALRRRAIERFARAGWPTNRLEQWRHTSLAGLETQTFAPPAAAPRPEALLARLRGQTDGPRSRADDGDGGGHWLVFVDGAFAPALSAIGALPAGATITALSAALAAREPDVEALFGSAEDGEAPSALNAALAGDGALIRIAPGIAVDAPIHLVFIGGVREGEHHVRNLVKAGAGTRATIVEHYVGEGDAATLTTAVTRIDAGADARIVHLKLQQEAGQAVHLAAIDAVQARGAAFTSHALAFGARLARTDIRTRFDGEGCHALLNGLYHVDGRRHVDHHTRIDHAQPRGTSEEHYRGIVDGIGHGVFCGRIVVAPGAGRTDALQRTDSLLLSPHAQADARPELEIYADDVKCTHGATVGRIDEESLFYLRSRGLDATDARNLLIRAFAAEALARIDLPSLRARAEAAIGARLPGGPLSAPRDGRLAMDAS
ncbi:MAG: Fe-S cluster assembly protein SufD [Lautropia sp.]